MGWYLDAIRMAVKFILDVEVFFETIDDHEYYSARMNLKGILCPHCGVWCPLTFGTEAYLTFAKLVCLAGKTVGPFTLLSHTQEAGSRQIGMTQELLALVTRIVHYLKILIRIVLTGALKLEKEQSVREAMPSFFDKLQDLLAVQSGDPGARWLIKNGSGEIMGQTGACTGSHTATGFLLLSSRASRRFQLRHHPGSQSTILRPIVVSSAHRQWRRTASGSGHTNGGIHIVYSATHAGKLLLCLCWKSQRHPNYKWEREGKGKGHGEKWEGPFQVLCRQTTSCQHQQNTLFWTVLDKATQIHRAHSLVHSGQVCPDTHSLWVPVQLCPDIHSYELLSSSGQYNPNSSIILPFITRLS